jgi:hypothetical protein
MSDLFHRFGKAYLDKEITDTSGSAKILVHPRRGEVIRVKVGESHPIEAKRFQVARRRMVFEGGSFNLRTDEPIIGVARDSAKLQPDGPWEPLPEEIETGCEEKKYKLLVTFAVATPAQNTFEVIDENEPAPEARVDECLLGQWKATASSMEGFLSRGYSGVAGARLQSLGVSGEARVRFTSGGRLFASARQVQARSRMNMGDVEADMTVTTNGTMCGRYWADGSTLKMWDIENLMQSESTVALKDGPTTRGSISHAEHQTSGTFRQPAAQFQYVCGAGNISSVLEEVDGQPIENVMYELVRTSR